VDVVSPTGLALRATSPVADRSLIELTGPAGTEVAARVYSASGRLVTTLFEGQLDGGTEHLTWLGTDQAGERVASGVYFVRLESKSESTTSKVVLVR
jgi:flagellar hook assembly protein FlgD